MRKEIEHKPDGLEAPPPMDEGWWESIMEQEDRYFSPQDQGKHERQEGEESRGRVEDWEWARKLYEKDDTIELQAVGYNQGGVLVEANSLRGFVPVSHLVSVEVKEGSDRTESLAGIIGRRLQLKVIEFDPDRGRLVLSERAALAAPGRRLEVLSMLKPGDRIRGRATNITRFGVFVDLGGIEGLIHVSELSWGRVRHPSDVVKVGEELEVQVLSVDPAQGRVGLSLKELLPDPWETVDQRFAVGDIVSGVVTNVVKFGAFVGIESGLEGLIHVSELGDGEFLHPRSVIREGEHVRARVVHIDAADRRLGLSLRDVPQEGEAAEGMARVEKQDFESGTESNSTVESWEATSAL